MVGNRCKTHERGVIVDVVPFRGAPHPSCTCNRAASVEDGEAAMIRLGGASRGLPSCLGVASSSGGSPFYGVPAGILPPPRGVPSCSISRLSMALTLSGSSVNSVSQETPLTGV